MIKTKIIKRAKSKTGGGSVSNGSGFAGSGGSSVGGSTDEARHAEEADHAKEADHAGTADTATRAANADHADSAKTLDEDSPIRNEFLSKIKGDRTPHELAVGGKLTAEGDIGSKDFAQGMAGGFGWKGDKEGNFEMQSLILRAFLEVPELRRNRTTVTVGNQWIASGAGIVDSYFHGVTMGSSTDYIGSIKLKLEEGEIGSFVEGDICMGIWHFEDGDFNSNEDKDDGKGDFRFAGFASLLSVVLSRGR